MPVEPITIMIGANASGKSNAIDGLQILSGLATNRELIDILDGIRGQEQGIRGGSRGAPRYDSTSFELGCSFNCENYNLDYEIKIGIKPKVRLLSESLYKKVTQGVSVRIWSTDGHLMTYRHEEPEIGRRNKD